MTKIRRDSRAFRDSESDLDYVKTRVKNIARNLVFDRIEFSNVHSYDSLEELINDLNLYYNNDNKKIIVMLKLKNSTFKQKYSENFISFVARLNEIMNSVEFTDTQKIHHFRELMLSRLRNNIVEIVNVTNYRLYIKNCIQIVNNLMQVDFENKTQSTYKSKKRFTRFDKNRDSKNDKKHEFTSFSKVKKQIRKLNNRKKKKSELIRLDRVIKIMIIKKNVCANCFESNHFSIDKTKSCKSQSFKIEIEVKTKLVIYEISYNDELISSEFDSNLFNNDFFDSKN